MSKSYDVCVMGSGAAGLYLVDLLSKEKLRVALVEAGPRDFARRREPYEVRCLARNHLGVNSARVTAFGGATNTWGGGLIRLAAEDLSALCGMPSTQWPLQYEELCNHYEKVEKRLNVRLPQNYLERGSYETSNTSFRQRLTTVLPFWRKNFARALGRGILSRPNVTSFFEVGDPAPIASRSDTLEAVELGGATRVEAKAFVIAAGVVNSNLMARRFLSAAGKENDFPSLGKGFHDHISIPLFSIHPRSHYPFSRRFSYRFSHTFMLVEHYERETVRREAGASVGAFVHFTFDFSQSRAIQLIKRSLETFQRKDQDQGSMRLSDFRNSPATIAKILVGWGLHRVLYIPEDVQITASLDLEQVPSANWRITRTDATTDLTWDIQARDVENAAHYAVASAELMKQLAVETPFSYQALFPDPVADASSFRKYVYQCATDTYHASGGVRVGTNTEDSVLSEDLAMHGLNNVYVLSTAAFPRVGGANPTLTLLALAQRLSEHLLHDTSKSS
jgi:choline dehydrogenase-like flavoprotein